MPSKRDLFLIQAGKCFYCGKFLSPFPFSEENSKGYTIDHVYPKSMLPKNTSHVENRVLSCRKCNMKKGNSLPTTHIIKKHERVKILSTII